MGPAGPPPLPVPERGPTMAIETVPGTSLRYHLIAFDAAGRERPEAGGGGSGDNNLK